MTLSEAILIFISPKSEPLLNQAIVKIAKYIVKNEAIFNNNDDEKNESFYYLLCNRLDSISKLLHEYKS